MTHPKLEALQKIGQSFWLDDIHRKRIASGELQGIVDRGVRGLTSNPAIFAEAITENGVYQQDLQQLALDGKNAQEIYEALAIEDIQQAADILHPVYVHSGGKDGYVSLEANPHLAHDAEATVEEIRRLAKAVNRPNAMFKVPATGEGLIAIRELVSQGYNINVTLIFSISQYELVVEAYLEGLEMRAERGQALRPVASVASFFVSRIDSKVDNLLDLPDRPDAEALKGKIGIASAKVVYERFRDRFESDRWMKLGAKGARLQRVLYGSTSTKNPDYPDTLYPDNLIGPETVNTVPPETLEAFMDHGTVSRTLDKDLAEAREQLERLESIGIDLAGVTRDLLDEGVKKFSDPYDRLIANITEKAAEALVA